MNNNEQIRKTLWRYKRGMINFYQMKRMMKKLLNEEKR